MFHGGSGDPFATRAGRGNIKRRAVHKIIDAAVDNIAFDKSSPRAPTFREGRNFVSKVLRL